MPKEICPECNYETEKVELDGSTYCTKCGICCSVHSSYKRGDQKSQRFCFNCQSRRQFELDSSEKTACSSCNNTYNEGWYIEECRFQYFRYYPTNVAAGSLLKLDYHADHENPKNTITVKWYPDSGSTLIHLEPEDLPPNKFKYEVTIEVPSAARKAIIFDGQKRSRILEIMIDYKIFPIKKKSFLSKILSYIRG